MKIEIKDLEEIKEQFTKVIQYSQSDRTLVHFDELFESWASNKCKFFAAMGNKLIVEGKPKAIELTDATKKTMFEQFKNSVRSYYYLYDFLEQISADQFFENKLKYNLTAKIWSYSDSENYELKTFLAGQKVIKMFKYFFHEEDEAELIRKLQDKASTLIQQTKIEGIPCISIHPLDYLSISENNRNWRSCHALNGDYRSGNLSYMADGTTVVFYLKVNAAPETLPRFPDTVPWNNKIWRNLVFFSRSREMVFFGRPYPYELDYLLEELLDLAKKETQLFRTSDKIKLKQDYVNYFTTISNKEVSISVEDYESYNRYIGNPYTKEITNIATILKENSEPLYYNDLLYSSSYLPYYWTQRLSTPIRTQEFWIGEDVICPCCGEYVLNDSTKMYCNFCNYDDEGE